MEFQSLSLSRYSSQDFLNTTTSNLSLNFPLTEERRASCSSIISLNEVDVDVEKYTKMKTDLKQALASKREASRAVEERERKIALILEDYRQLQSNYDSCQLTLRKTKAEVTKLKSQVRGNEDLYKKKTKAAEKDSHKLKEHLTKTIKNPKATAQLGIELLNPLPKVEGQRARWKTEAVQSRIEKEQLVGALRKSEALNSQAIDHNLELANVINNMLSVVAKTADKEHHPRQSWLMSVPGDEITEEFTKLFRELPTTKLTSIVNTMFSELSKRANKQHCDRSQEFFCQHPVEEVEEEFFKLMEEKQVEIPPPIPAVTITESPDNLDKIRDLTEKVRVLTDQIQEQDYVIDDLRYIITNYSGEVAEGSLPFLKNSYFLEDEVEINKKTAELIRMKEDIKLSQDQCITAYQQLQQEREEFASERSRSMPQYPPPSTPPSQRRRLGSFNRSRGVQFQEEQYGVLTPTRGGTRTPTTAEFFDFLNMTPVYPAGRQRKNSCSVCDEGSSPPLEKSARRIFQFPASGKENQRPTSPEGRVAYSHNHHSRQISPDDRVSARQYNYEQFLRNKQAMRYEMASRYGSEAPRSSDALKRSYPVPCMMLNKSESKLYNRRKPLDPVYLESYNRYLDISPRGMGGSYPERSPLVHRSSGSLYRTNSVRF